MVSSHQSTSQASRLQQRRRQILSTSLLKSANLSSLQSFEAATRTASATTSRHPPVARNTSRYVACLPSRPRYWDLLLLARRSLPISITSYLNSIKLNRPDIKLFVEWTLCVFDEDHARVNSTVPALLYKVEEEILQRGTRVIGYTDLSRTMIGQTLEDLAMDWGFKDRFVDKFSGVYP